MESPDYSPAHEHNRRAWDRLVRGKKRFTRPANDQDFADPLGTVDGLQWLGGSVAGHSLLCLGAGGGRQSALYAAAGASVTVVDISGAMLELDRQVAAERQLDVTTVETSMDDLSMLRDASFDTVIHPVSTCYVPDISRVYQEVARVMRGGGIYVSQHKQPVSMQVSSERSAAGYLLAEPYYRQEALPPSAQPSRLREEGTLEFLHRWEQLIGVLCRSGFVIEDLIEPHHADGNAPVGSFGHRCCFIAPYVRIKARRLGAAPSASGKILLG